MPIMSSQLHLIKKNPDCVSQSWGCGIEGVWHQHTSDLMPVSVPCVKTSLNQLVNHQDGFIFSFPKYFSWLEAVFLQKALYLDVKCLRLHLPALSIWSTHCKWIVAGISHSRSYWWTGQFTSITLAGSITGVFKKVAKFAFWEERLGMHQDCILAPFRLASSIGEASIHLHQIKMWLVSGGREDFFERWRRRRIRPQRLRLCLQIPQHLSLDRFGNMKKI